MTKFEAAPGWLFHDGKRFACPSCGNQDFNVEADVIPYKYWCTCGLIYTEDTVNEIRDPERERELASRTAPTENAPVQVMMDTGFPFECKCGSTEFKITKDDAPLHYFCRCGQVYTEKDFARAEPS